MNIQDLEKLIKGRRSIRQWKKQEVPEELLKKAVELATWAPNGGNYQGWRFVVVKNKEVIGKMADAVQSVADKMASWPEAKSWEEDIKRYQKNALLRQAVDRCDVEARQVGRCVRPSDRAIGASLSAAELSRPHARRDDVGA